MGSHYWGYAILQLFSANFQATNIKMAQNFGNDDYGVKMFPWTLRILIDPRGEPNRAKPQHGGW